MVKKNIQGTYNIDSLYILVHLDFTYVISFFLSFFYSGLFCEFIRLTFFASNLYIHVHYKRLWLKVGG